MRIICLLLFFLLPGTGIYAQAPQPDKRLVEDPTLIGVSSKLDGSAKLYSVPWDKKRLFILTFYNPDSPNMYEVESISFHGNTEDLNNLYEFLKKGFTSKERRILNLEDDQSIGVSYAYSSILVEVLRKEGPDGWFFLSRKQLDRLFGKY